MKYLIFKKIKQEEMSENIGLFLRDADKWYLYRDTEKLSEAFKYWFEDRNNILVVKEVLFKVSERQEGDFSE